MRILSTSSLFLVAFFLLLALPTGAQTVVEAAFSAEELIIETWWVKALDNKYKWSLFNLNEANYNWDTQATSFVSYAVLGYDAWKGLGPALGYRISGARASLLAGLQYTFYQKDFFITTNFTSEIRDHPFFEFYLLTQYRKKWFKKSAFFGQWQSSINFSEAGHDFSFQRLRLGLDWGLVQLGVALNQVQVGKSADSKLHPGVFARLQFQ
ncbi:MAG: hypothetical protein AAGD05_05090 [Bacteroidota bacterium]